MDGSHSDMSGFHSLHSNNKAQRRNQNGATGGEGSSSSGNTDESHSDVSGFHSLHSNDQPQKRTSGDTKSSQSSIMSQPGTLASTEEASYAKDSNVSPGDTKSSQSSIMSKPGTLASTEDASYVNDPRVTVTLAPPLHEADTSNGGSQLNQNRAPEGEGSSSSGSSTDGSHSDMSSFHNLLSNDKAHRRSSPDRALRRDLLKPHSLSIKDVMAFALTGRTLSTDSSNSDMSGCLSLHSNDEVEGRTPPMAALRSEKVTPSYSDDFSHPATLASTESAPRDDASPSSKFLHVGRSLSEVGGSSEISNWHSLRSTDRNPRRRRTPPMVALRSEKVTPSDSDDFSRPGTLASTESAPHNGASRKPQFLRSLSEVGGSSEISNWHSLRSTDRTLRRRRLHST